MLYPESLFLSSITLLVVALISMMLRQTWRSKEMLKHAWKSMPSFDSAVLIVGFWLFLTIPLLQEDSSAVGYLPSVMIEILKALASAMFVVGTLSFLKIAHEYEKPKPNKVFNFRRENARRGRSVR